MIGYFSFSTGNTPVRYENVTEEKENRLISIENVNYRKETESIAAEDFVENS